MSDEQPDGRRAAAPVSPAAPQPGGGPGPARVPGGPRAEGRADGGRQDGGRAQDPAGGGAARDGGGARGSAGRRAAGRADGGRAAGEAAGDDGQGENEAREERERSEARFRGAHQDPLSEGGGEAGDTGSSAAASREYRSARKTFGLRGDLNTFDRNVFHSAHIGDVHVRLAAGPAGPAGTAVFSGDVPEEELRRVRRIFREPPGYVRLKQALRARRVLVLGGAPGSGRTCTALSLLDEVTDTAGGAGPLPAAGPGASAGRISRLDPVAGVRGLTPEWLAGQGAGRGYVLELPTGAGSGSPPTELHLDALAGELERRASYAVIVVASGTDAEQLVLGRYGMLCPPPSTGELLNARLDELLGDLPGADGEAPPLARAAELALDDTVAAAVGIEELRPAEAEVLAGLLADHVRGALSRDQLLDGCRMLVIRQVYSWFMSVDRDIAPRSPDRPASGAAVPGAPSAADVLYPSAFRIALAVLNGAAHSTVADAAHLLAWELAVARDPERPPARPLFCDDQVSVLMLSRAEPAEGRTEVAGVAVPERTVRFQGDAFPSAVLDEVWRRHHAARGPVVRWLRSLADDPRPRLWVRAAVAAGELCVRDFGYGYEELVRPLATASAPRRRVFAATALDQAALREPHRSAVHALVREWAGEPARALRWTAAAVLGYGNGAATVEDALTTLTGIGVQDDGDLLGVVSYSVVRLAAGADDLAVLRRMRRWTADSRTEHQDLGLLCAVRLAVTRTGDVWDDREAPDLADHEGLALPLALVLAREDRVEPLADVMWTALNTARSHEAATDALGGWLRAAAGPGPGSRVGAPTEDRDTARQALGLLLPPLMAHDRDRQRLDWLLRRMVADPDDPLPEPEARALWRMATGHRTAAARPGRSEGEGGRG